MKGLPEGYALDDRMVIVTGGAMGIGAGITEVLAEAGATVVIADIVRDRMIEQVERIRAAGGKADGLPLDLANEDSIVACCKEAIARRGTPWALVNNAGLQDRQLLLDGTSVEWDRMNSVNARGAFLMMREVGRAMVAGGAGGRIVNVASAALIGSLVKGLVPYSGSKGAMLGMSRAAAMELAEHKITVNTLLPGGVMTPGATTAKGPPAEGPARRMPPLGFCEPRDMGNAVLFFVAPAGRYVTNQVIAVDAGWSVT